MVSTVTGTVTGTEDDPSLAPARVTWKETAALFGLDSRSTSGSTCAACRPFGFFLGLGLALSGDVGTPLRRAATSSWVSAMNALPGGNTRPSLGFMYCSNVSSSSVSTSTRATMGTPTPSLRPTAPSSSLTSSAALTAGAPTVRRCVTGTGLTFATLPPARRTMRVSVHGVLSRERTRLSDLERLEASRSSPALLRAFVRDRVGAFAGDRVGDWRVPAVPGRAGDLAPTALAEMPRPGDGLPTTRVSATLATIAGAIGDASDPRGPPIAALSPRTVTGDAGAGAARDVLGREGTTGTAERGLDDRVGAARAEFGLRAVPFEASSVPAPTAGPWPVVCHLSLCARITSFAVLDSFANALAAMHASEAAATPAGPPSLTSLSDCRMVCAVSTSRSASSTASPRPSSRDCGISTMWRPAACQQFWRAFSWHEGRMCLGERRGLVGTHKTDHVGSASRGFGRWISSSEYSEPGDAPLASG